MSVLSSVAGFLAGLILFGFVIYLFWRAANRQIEEIGEQTEALKKTKQADDRTSASRVNVVYDVITPGQSHRAPPGDPKDNGKTRKKL